MLKIASRYLLVFGAAACGAHNDVEAVGSTNEADTVITPNVLGSVEYVPGDFNFDVNPDLLVVTPGGTSLLLGTGSGTFGATAFVRSDLPMGTVKYAPGLFSSDAATDVMIMTAGGTFLYTGHSSPGPRILTPDVFIDRSLTIGSTDEIPGDFNGDGKTDLLTVTSSGTTLQLSTWVNGVGFALSPSWSRSDLTRGNVEYVVGDFSGDFIPDLMITTSHGSFEYVAQTSGAFISDVWTRTDLPRGNVQFTPGDFNGDHVGDLIITTSHGSFEYLGIRNGGFNANPWTRTDLKLGNVAYTPGDFNGDAITDLIITTASGSFEYLGQANGGFLGDAWVRNDLPLGKVRYTAAHLDSNSSMDLLIVTKQGTTKSLGRQDGGFDTAP